MSLNKEPDSSFEAQQLALALQEYIDAAHAERKGREEFDGHSWDHYGRTLIEQRDSASETFTLKLNSYVDHRVMAILKQVYGEPSP